MSTTITTNRFDGTRRRSPDEMAARREELLEQLRQLLADRGVSSVDVATQLDISRSTAHAYLCRLEGTGEAQRTGSLDGYRRELWAPGSAQPSAAFGDMRDCSAPLRPMAPAQQIGMWRDGLVAALFGPAQQGVAA